MTKYALLIGNNYKTTSCSLQGCINDVLNIQKFLIEKRGFVPSNIVLMTDDAGITPDNLSTRDNIFQNIDGVTSKLKSGDELYLHYSGHGGLEKSPDGKYEKIGQCETIFASELIEITDEEIKARLVNKIPAGAKFRSVFDSCHSGSVCNLPFSLLRDGIYENEDAPCEQSDDAIELSGCRDDQTSDDSVDSRGVPAGALTAALLEALQHDDWNWEELLTVVRANLRRHHHNQAPVLSFGRKGFEKLKVDI